MSEEVVCSACKARVKHEGVGIMICPNHGRRYFDGVCVRSESGAKQKAWDENMRQKMEHAKQHDEQTTTHPLPTPRTDALENDTQNLRQGEWDSKALELARTLEREAAELRVVCAAAYQLAGLVGAPVRFLDVFGDAANGELGKRSNPETLLPVDLDECDEVAELRAQLALSEGMYRTAFDRAETAERQRDEAQRDAERYLDGFTVLLAYAYQMGFFTGDDSPRIRAWLEACPQRPGVTVGTAIDAAIDAAKEGKP